MVISRANHATNACSVGHGTIRFERSSKPGAADKPSKMEATRARAGNTDCWAQCQKTARAIKDDALTTTRCRKERGVRHKKSDSRRGPSYTEQKSYCMWVGRGRRQNETTPIPRKTHQAQVGKKFSSCRDGMDRVGDGGGERE